MTVFSVLGFHESRALSERRSLEVKGSKSPGCLGRFPGGREGRMNPDHRKGLSPAWSLAKDGICRDPLGLTQEEGWEREASKSKGEGKRRRDSFQERWPEPSAH